MWISSPIFVQKRRSFGWIERIFTVIEGDFAHLQREKRHCMPQCLRRSEMITFKRTRKRSYQHPGEKYLFYGIAGVFTLMLVMLVVAFSGRSRMNEQLLETREMMASSIQSDMSRALDSYGGINRKSADLQGDILPTMRQHMYAANSMNKVLTETYGEEYSMIDKELYDSFQAIMEEFDKRLSAGQSTESAKEQLIACMNGMTAELGNRFGADGLLLPKTASK